MKKQIIFIHGGDSFDSYEKYLEHLKNFEFSIDWFLSRKKWSISLAEDLGGDFQVFAPNMPNKQNARYAEWKIWFEKMLPFIEDEVVLVGHSQGGIFLAKYLSENIYPKKIAALMLVAAPHTDTPETGDFNLMESLENISRQCKAIHLFYSKDDPIVLFSEMERYQEDLPGAQAHIFSDRGHFLQETFPEIIAEIKRI